MSDNLLQRSVTTAVARNLASTTKTSPKMMSITPRWLLSLLPWVHVQGGSWQRYPNRSADRTAREKVGVLSFVLFNRPTEEVGRLLDLEGIAVRAGHHCAQPSLRRFALKATV